ncbi:MAG: FkbM family methyltransferase [Flavobacterium sp.]|nr:MAG: FkbM family methyltransferase [Flavobacterium sp.]
MTLNRIKDSFSRWPIKKALQISLAIFLERFGVKAYESLLLEERLYKWLVQLGYSVTKLKNHILVHDKDLNRTKVLLRRETSDVRVFIQIFVENEFGGLLELIKDKSRIKTIVDAGANIGISSIKFNCVFSNALITAVEPDAGNFSLLKQNLAANNVNSKVVQSGLWNRKTKLYFDHSFRDGKEWSISVTEKPNAGPYIESISINDLIESNQLELIDILKIDIEGSEKQVFLGTNNLSFLDRTRYLAVELHPEIVDKEAIANILANKGFELSTSGEYLIGENKNFKLY